MANWGTWRVALWCGCGLMALACSSEVTLFGDAGAGAGGGVGGNVGQGGSGNAGNNEGGGGLTDRCVDDIDCVSDAECLDGICSDGSCTQTPLPVGTTCSMGVCDANGFCVADLGSPCVDGSECLSGICSDNACCDTACDQLCETCNAPGGAGVCQPIGPGIDPDDDCAGDGVCDGALACVSGDHVLSDSFGSTQSQFARDVAVDSLGNIVVLGYFFNQIDLGGGTLTSAGFRDIFLVKFDPNGNHLWSARHGDGSSDYGWELEIAANNDIIVAGYFRGSLNFDVLNQPSMNALGQTDAFVARLDPDGGFIWQKSFGDANFEEVSSLDVMPNGNIVIGGYFQTAIDFGGGPLLGAGSLDAYVAVFDGAGNHQWSNAYGDVDSQRVYGTQFDASGNVIAVGRHLGTITFGATALTSAGSRDIFVAKLDALTGNTVWAQQYGDGADQLAWDVAVDSNNDIIVAGYNEGVVNFGGADLTTADQQDIVVAKLDQNGAHVWSTAFGGVGNQEPNAVAVDSLNRVVLTGNFQGDVDFGAGLVTSLGQEDAYVTKLTEDGEHLWNNIYGSMGSEIGFGVTTDQMDNVIAVGHHSGTVDFGSGPLASSGGFDMFVVKLSP
jgi:hypothetical protein